MTNLFHAECFQTNLVQTDWFSTGLFQNNLFHTDMLQTNLFQAELVQTDGLETALFSNVCETDLFKCASYNIISVYIYIYILYKS